MEKMDLSEEGQEKRRLEQQKNEQMIRDAERAAEAKRTTQRLER